MEMTIMIFTILATILLSDALNSQALDLIFTRINRIVSIAFSLEFYYFQVVPAMLCLFMFAKGTCGLIDVWEKYSGIVCVYKSIYLILITSGGLYISYNHPKLCQWLNERFEQWQFKYKYYLLGILFSLASAYYLIDFYIYVLSQ